jgi:hypothetical protein
MHLEEVALAAFPASQSALVGIVTLKGAGQMGC